jgi:hypothetical protein
MLLGLYQQQQQGREGELAELYLPVVRTLHHNSRLNMVSGG